MNSLFKSFLSLVLLVAVAPVAFAAEVAGETAKAETKSWMPESVSKFNADHGTGLWLSTDAIKARFAEGYKGKAEITGVPTATVAAIWAAAYFASPAVKAKTQQLFAALKAQGEKAVAYAKENPTVAYGVAGAAAVGTAGFAYYKGYFSAKEDNKKDDKKDDKKDATE